MKNLLAALAFFCAFDASSAEWLTVIGDGSRGDVDAVEVSPASLVVNSDVRVLQVRTSRATARVSWDGVPYRSYEAVVEFDCINRTARYQQLRYFNQPRWVGESHKTVTYTVENPRWMAFRDMSPNPTLRIIAAVCSLERVSTVRH